jgi:hypothetical protein
MRLTRLLITKSLAETLFVSALAVYFYFTTAPAVYQGWTEVTARGIAGWVVNRQQKPGEHVEVQLYVDGRFIGNTFADISRPDVVAAGRARDEHCGFNFELPTLSTGEHEAQAYALHYNRRTNRRALLSVGPHLRFKVETGGNLLGLPSFKTD